SKEDFEKLHEDLILEWRPRDRSEQETILDLALVYWQKRTLWRMRQTAVVKHPFTGDILATKRKSWAGIRKRLRSAAKSGRTLLGVVEAQEAKLFSQVDAMRKKIDAASNREEVKLIEEKIDALMRTMAEHVLPLMQALNQGPNPEQVFDT